MIRTIKGYSLTLIPKSWKCGRWYRPHKTIFSLGPLRFTVHRLRGTWKWGK